MSNSLEKNVSKYLFVLIILSFISLSSVFSQNRSRVLLHKMENLHDSTLLDESLMKNHISSNFKIINTSITNNWETIALNEKDWENLSDFVKNRLAKSFQIQRFIYFSDKEIEIYNWHFDFIVNKYNYFISSNLYQQVLNELSDD